MKRLAPGFSEARPGWPLWPQPQLRLRPRGPSGPAPTAQELSCWNHSSWVSSQGCPQLCLLPFPFRPKEGNRENGAARSKRALEEEEGSVDVLSKNKQKKQLRNPHKTFDPSLKRKLLLLLAWGRCLSRNPGEPSRKGPDPPTPRRGCQQP